MNERPTPPIDARTFQDLVDGAKQQIPVFCPEWTNHGPNDPGIALIELFAWMTDRAISELNRVPGLVYDEFLRLIGFEMFPDRAAAADLLFHVRVDGDQHVTIPAGTVVGTTQPVDGHPVEFQTDDMAVVRPVGRPVVLASTPEQMYLDVTDDLIVGSEVSILEPPEPGGALLLGFEHSCADQVLEIEVDSTMLGLGVDPSDPPLVWEAWTGESWMPVRVVNDDTGGLQRSGRVACCVPGDHDPIEIGGRRAHWIRARIGVARPGQAHYARSPVLRSVTVTTIGAIVPATHSSPMGREFLGTADGSPGLTFTTSRSPVLPLSPDEHVLVAGEAWSYVDSFGESGVDDRHFSFSPEAGTIRFGPLIRRPDGAAVQHGQVPAVGSDVHISSYRVGGGSSGNVGSNTLTVLANSIPFVDGVTNPAPAAGGTDAETMDEAKRRAPLWLQTGDRAVTASDFERLARWSHPDVARARCLDRGDGTIRLLVVPRVDADPDLHLDDLALGAGLTQELTREIDERRLLGSRIGVDTPFYQGISAVVLVRARPGRSEARVRERCLESLHRLLHPTLGGPDGAGWPFGHDVDAYALTPALSAVSGVESIVEVLLFEVDLASSRRLGSGQGRIAIAPDSLPLLALAQVVVE